MHSKDDFYSAVSSKWGFINPDKYFIYTGNVPMQSGQLDSRTVMAGSPLNSIADWLPDYDLDGTVGGQMITFMP
jgi:hypothetical protein